MNYDLKDIIAKALADKVGHGMREKCERHAEAVLAVLDAEALEPATALEVEVALAARYNGTHYRWPTDFRDDEKPRVRAEMRRAIEAIRRLPQQDGPERFVGMPVALTAENGAKAALIGEFTVTVREECPECDGSGGTERGCPACNATGGQSHEAAIPWTTIKSIYAAAVALFNPEVPRG